ncbi:glycoside hydrolase family 88 protein [Bacteroidota bacterium]
MKKTLSIILTICLFSLGSSCNKNDKVFNKRHIKKTMRKAANWQLDHPKHELTDWTNGAFYTGVTAAYEATGSRRIFKALMEMGESNAWKPGR